MTTKIKAIATILIMLFLAIGIEPVSFSQTQDQLGRAYVVNAFSGDVSVINTDTHTEIARISIGVQEIFDVAVTPDGRRAYVSGGVGADSLFVIRTIDNTVIGEIIGISSPCGMDITPDGSYIYVASWATDEVAIVRIPDGMTRPPVAVGDMPMDVAVTPDGEFVYVANFGDNTISVIRTSDNTVVETVSVGIEPLNLAMHPDGGFVYVACYGRKMGPTYGGVYVIDTSSNTVVNIVTIYGYGTRGMDITPDGEYVYVASREYHEVNVIRTLDNVELMEKRVTLPDDAEPRWIAITPEGDYAYVTLHTTRQVAVIDTADNALIRMDVGEGPVGIDTAQIAPEESAWGPTLVLSAPEAYLGAVVHATVTGIVPKYQTMTLEVVLPLELSYVEFSFKVNRIPTTPSVGPDGISYTLGWGWGMDYTVEFDFKVTKVYEEDREVHPSVMGIFCDEFGNEIGFSGVIFRFTIYSSPQWDRYHSYSDIEAFLRSLARLPIAKVQSIGVSHEGREIWAIKISDEPDIEDEDEPDLLFVGLHHAREWISAEVPLYLAVNLVQKYYTDSLVKTLVDESEIWIVPVVNPDGLEYSRSGVFDPETGYSARYWRKNRRVNDDGTHGVDLDRNYGYQWGRDLDPSIIEDGSPNPFDITYWGPSSFSEPETRAIRDLILHPSRNFQIVVNYHSYSQLILYPWGYTQRSAEDFGAMSLAAEMSHLIYGVHGERYTPQQAYDVYPVSGTLADWVYQTKRIPAYTIELRPESADPFWTGFLLPESEILATCEENWVAALYPILSEVADIFVYVVADTPEGDFHVTIRAGEVKRAPVTSWEVISRTNIYSWGIGISDDRMILNINGRLQDPNCGGRIVLEVDPDGEIITYAIDMAQFGSLYVDIKPGSWPNPLELKSKGVLSVAVCGTEDFDVTTIDPDTIRLSLEGNKVAPILWSYKDVATPYTGKPCSGHNLGGDGYLDLTLKFKTIELIKTLGLNAFEGPTVIVLFLTGNLKEQHGGTPIEGRDCIVILK